MSVFAYIHTHLKNIAHSDSEKLIRKKKEQNICERDLVIHVLYKNQPFVE